MGRARGSSSIRATAMRCGRFRIWRDRNEGRQTFPPSGLLECPAWPRLLAPYTASRLTVLFNDPPLFIGSGRTCPQARSSERIAPNDGIDRTALQWEHVEWRVACCASACRLESSSRRDVERIRRSALERPSVVSG